MGSIDVYLLFVRTFFVEEGYTIAGRFCEKSTQSWFYSRKFLTSCSLLGAFKGLHTTLFFTYIIIGTHHKNSSSFLPSINESISRCY